MEWLSEEEKSRSMMPYLMDLPPLDVNGDQVKAFTADKEDIPIKTKTASKKTTSKDVEIEK